MESSSATLNMAFRSSLCCLILPAASCTGFWAQRGEQRIALLDVGGGRKKEKREFFPSGGSLLLFSHFQF